MRAFGRSVATTAIAAAMTISGVSMAAAATDPSSVRAETTAEVGTAGFGVFFGYGYSATAYIAILNAEFDAERQARFAGYDPFFDCNVVSSWATEMGPGYYQGRVQLNCWN